MDRLDSDIYAPYGMVQSVKPISDAEWESDYWRNLPARKKKKVAWFVTNCHTPSQREIFVSELEKYIDVDIYGQCGELKCPRGSDRCCK